MSNIGLAVGVNLYQRDEISDLHNAVRDASEVKTFLQAWLPKERQFAVELLDNPTAPVFETNVCKCVELLKKKEQTEHCVFFIFFAGHGWPHEKNLYLLCNDASRGVISNTSFSGCMSYSYLESLVTELRNTDVIFFFDACRRNIDAYAKAPGGGKPMEMERDPSPSAPKGMSVEEQEAHCRRLLVTTCADGERASDNGMTMKLILNAMRKSVDEGAGLELGPRFFLDRVSPLFEENQIVNQHPTTDGNPITLVPATNPETDEERALRTLRKKYPGIDELLRMNGQGVAPPKPAPKDSGWEESSSRKAGTRKTLNLSGMECGFCWCPAGTFLMGSPESEKYRDDDETQHKVKLSRGFWMLETAVTQRLWTAVMGDNPSRFKWYDLPVERVSWNETHDFLKKLNEKTSALGLSFRLPTEAEWEYACRAGTSTAYFWGNKLNGDRANCDGRNPYGTETEGPYLAHTIAVKSYQPNGWGLYDMHGNVFEWCEDWYGGYPTGPVTDPQGPDSGSDCVLRGGGWRSLARDCRSAYRSLDDPSYRGFSAGFRFLSYER